MIELECAALSYHQLYDFIDTFVSCQRQTMYALKGKGLNLISLKKQA